MANMPDCRSVRNDSELWELYRDSWSGMFAEAELRRTHQKWVDITAEIWPKSMRRKPPVKKEK